MILVFGYYLVGGYINSVVHGLDIVVYLWFALFYLLLWLFDFSFCGMFVGLLLFEVFGLYWWSGDGDLQVWWL